VSTRRFSQEPVASFRAALWAVALALVLPGVAAAQANDDCLSCHSDAEATGEKAGQQISVYVDPKAYSGRSTESSPASTAMPTSTVPSCLTPRSSNQRTAPAAMTTSPPSSQPVPTAPAADLRSPSALCVRCHGAHDVLPARDPASATTPTRVTAQCAACHDRESRAVELGVHRGGGGVGCADCHRGHAVVAPADRSASSTPAGSATRSRRPSTGAACTARQPSRATRWRRAALSATSTTPSSGTPIRMPRPRS